MHVLRVLHSVKSFFILSFFIASLLVHNVHVLRVLHSVKSFFILSFFIASLFVAAKENFSGCHQKLYLDCFPFANCVWFGLDPVCKFLWLSPSCVWIGSHLQCFPIDSRLKICKGRIQLFIRASSFSSHPLCI